MPRTAEQSALLRQKRKAKILEKALWLFASLTFDNLTIDDIASACNCSHGLFYHYFTSKESIYNALIEQRAKNHPDWVFPGKKFLEVGGFEGLRMSIDWILQELHKTEEAALYLRMDFLRPFSTLRKTEPLLGQNIFEVFKKLIKQANDEKTIINCEPEDLAIFLIDTAIGAVTRRISLGNNDYKTADLELVITSLKARRDSN